LAVSGQRSPRRLLARMLCALSHRWIFQPNHKPPIVVCARCGLTAPMPYGDDRLRYL
jgi:hypothetical protein